MDDKRMFSQLMEEQPTVPAPEPRSQPPKTRPTEAIEPAPLLPPELEDLSDVGYTSHSYRLTEAELRWLRRFCIRLSERLDRTVSHNTLIRLLLRIGASEWERDPQDNRLTKLLRQLKN